ncbi:MAG: DUF1667 domain-containing protein [Gammaproteobacteria bacterium]|nr:DUF1667 domain-containing protein [Gammaproteobacteria bacterium]
MTQQEMICICCPIGCNLSVEKIDGVIRVTGNKCPRGKAYAEQELLNPERIVTTTVKLTGGLYPVIPVKTGRPIPKTKIFEVMDILSNVEITVPVHIGDVVVKNILDTGVDVVITKNDMGGEYERS